MIPLTRAVTTEADVRAVADAFRSGWLTMGPRTAAFEDAFATAAGRSDAVAVSSGTSALHLALLALGVRPGDEVLVPALTFAGLDAVVARTGGRAVPCDVAGVQDHRVAVAALERAVGPATAAVVVDHRWGRVVEMAPVLELAARHGVPVVEDASHAILAPGVGRAAVTCCSLSSTKALALGEGGVVTTDDDGVADRIRSLRSHAMTSGTWDRHRGHATTYDVVDLGYNARIDEPRAALGSSALQRVPETLIRRRRLVRHYLAQLDGLPGVLPTPERDDAPAGYGAFGVVLGSAARREAVATALRRAGVQTQPERGLPAATASAAPVAADVASRLLRLPFHDALSADDVDRICGVVAGAA